MADDKKTDLVGIPIGAAVYQDVARPAAQEVGTGLNTLARVFTLALRPLRLLVEGGHAAFDQLEKLLGARLRDVPPERVVEPRPEISGPLLLNFPFVQGEPDLAEMYVELLAKAMDTDSRRGIHPSFVDVLRQISPDEARLLRLIDSSRMWPVLRLRLVGATGTFDYVGFLSQLDKAADIEVPENLAVYYENLRRLQIVDIDWSSQVASPDSYACFSSELEALRSEISATRPQSKIEYEKGVLELSPFGIGFVKAALRRKPT